MGVYRVILGDIGQLIHEETHGNWDYTGVHKVSGEYEVGLYVVVGPCPYGVLRILVTLHVGCLI